MDERPKRAMNWQNKFILLTYGFVFQSATIFGKAFLLFKTDNLYIQESKVVCMTN